MEANEGRAGALIGTSTLAPHEVRELDLRGPSALREAGCICEFGCRSCGKPWAAMGGCPAWDPCPMGRAVTAGCPVHGDA